MNDTLTLDKITIEINASASDANANIEKLASTLSSLKSATKGGFGNLQTLAKGLTELKNASTGMDKVSAGLASLDKVSQSLQNLSNISNPRGLSKLTQELIWLPYAMKGFDEDTMSNITRVSNELAEAFTPLANKLADIAQGFSTISAMANKYGISITKIRDKTLDLSKYTKIFSTAINGTQSILKGLTKQSQTLINGFTKNASKVSSKIKQIGLSLLGTRTIFTATRKAVSEYMAMDSELTWKVTNNWRALGAQLAPLIEYVTYLFKQFVRVIYSVVLALTGIDLIARANEKAMAGWGKAAKDTLGNLQKFDDLNVVEFPKGSGDDNKLIDLDPIDLSPIQKVIDWVRKLKEEIKEAWNTGQWYGVGKVFAEGVNDALGGLNPDAILSKMDKIMSNIADGVNGLMENLKGANIGKAIELGLSIIPSSINMFLEKVNWDIIGVRITEALDNIDFSKILNEIFGVIANSFNAVQRIFLNIDTDTLANSITQIVAGLARAITRVITTIKWSEIGKKIHEVILKIDWKEIWQAIFDGLKAFLAGLGSLVAGTLFGTEFKTEAGAIFAGIGSLLGIKLISGLTKILSSGLASVASLIGGKLTSGISKLFSKGKGLGDVASSSSGFKLPDPKEVLKGLADLAIIIGGLTALIAAIGLVMKIPGAKEVMTNGIQMVVDMFTGIGKIILPLAAVSGLTAAMGLVGIMTMVQGFAGLALVIDGLAAVIGVIGLVLQIPNVKSIMSDGLNMLYNMFNTLGKVLVPFGVVTGLVIAMGFVTPMVMLSGLAGLAIVIDGLALVVASLGALSQVPGFTWLVGEGGALLITMAKYLGEFAGTLVASFVSAALDGIVEMGTKLSEFMKEAKPFFEGLTHIDTSVTDAVKNMVEVMLLLTANNIIDGLTSWITGGSGDQLLKFGKMLPEFGKYMKAYANAISGIDADMVLKTSDAVKSIAEFADLIPNSGGLWSKIAGDNQLDKFGEMLAKFGPYFASYYESIKGINADIVKTTSDAVTSVINFADIIPNSGGLWSLVAGDNTLVKFGKELASFGGHFVKYYDKIKNIKPDVVKSSSDAVSSIMEFARIIPNSGGLWSLIAGDNDIADFGEDLADFGKSFKEYYQYISKISANTINTVTNAIAKIVEQYKIIHDNKLDKTVGDFSKALKNSSGDLVSFFNNTFSSSQAWSIGYSFGASLGSAIASGIRSTRFPSLSMMSTDSGQTLQTFRINAYANGGYVDSGQFFFANENGIPEYVGSIGNRAAVANNHQIIEGIKQGVKEAMMETESSQNLTIKLGNDTLYKAQQKYNRRQNDVYGTDVTI